MRVYNYSQARQGLAELLNRASAEGAVEIRRRDGQGFLVRPAPRSSSPLNVPGIDTGLSRAEILEFVRASRRLNREAAGQNPGRTGTLAA